MGENDNRYLFVTNHKPGQGTAKIVFIEEARTPSQNPAVLIEYLKQANDSVPSQFGIVIGAAQTGRRPTGAIEYCFELTSFTQFPPRDFPAFAGNVLAIARWLSRQGIMGIKQIEHSTAFRGQADSIDTPYGEREPLAPRRESPSSASWRRTSQ